MVSDHAVTDYMLLVAVSLIASLVVDFIWKKIYVINHLLKKYE